MKCKKIQRILVAVLISNITIGLCACQDRQKNQHSHNQVNHSITIETQAQNLNTLNSVEDAQTPPDHHQPLIPKHPTDNKTQSKEQTQTNQLEKKAMVSSTDVDLDDDNQNSFSQPNQNKTIQGTQISKVKYKNPNGMEMTATFQTSAIGELKVQVVLPDNGSVTLTAPQSGGNNPIYESTDGSIVLVSHAGGGSVDLLINREIFEFEAVSAEAEVITGVSM